MKQIISLLLCLAMVLPIVPAQALAQESAEKPPEMAVPLSSDLDNTRVIDTAEEFMAIMDDPDGSYRLEADLDLGEVLPLGYDPETGNITHFTGSLDGNGCTLTYSIRGLPEDPAADYRKYYGLFASMRNAEVFSLNLDADMDLVVDSSAYVYAGLLTGMAHSSTFAGIQVDGSICAESIDASKSRTCYVSGLVGYVDKFGDTGFAYTVVTACDLDLDVQLRSAGGSMSYSGITDVTTDWAGQVYYTNVTGSVEAYGDGITIKLLDNCEYCTCSQNMDLTATGTIKAVGSKFGIGNAVSGIYTVTGASTDASVNLTALEFCDDSCFYGSMTATGTAGFVALLGASLGDWVQVECPMRVHMPGMEVNVRGIERCNDSSFTGDFDMTGGHVHSSAMQECNRSISYCNMYCEAIGCNLYPLASCYDCYGEGNVVGNCRSGPKWGGAWGCAISGDRNYYCGDMIMSTDEDEARITGISGNENMLEGDLTTKTNRRSVILVSSGDNNFCAGNVRRTSHSDDVKPDLQESFRVFDGTNSYFKGTVECMDDFYMGGTSCYMDASVKVDGRYAIIVDLSGENNYFTGSADFYYHGGILGLYNNAMTAYCIGDFPITVHHVLGGVFNTADMGSHKVYYHWPECNEKKHMGYPTYLYDVDVTDPDYWCYMLAVDVGRSNDSGTAESAVEGWANAFDPEEQVVRPKREPAGYTLQAVNANGDGVGNVLFYLEGQAYEADENGMVEISGGPGAIAPLVITAPSEDGADTLLRRINTFYPIPDRLNQIRVSEALELEFSMAGKEAPSGSFERTGGFTFDLFGHEVKIFDLPMEVDLNVGTDAFKINVKYNQDTGLYDATVGTVSRAEELPDKKEVLQTLMQEAFPKATICPPRKMKMFGTEWSYEALGCFSFEWDGVGSDFVIHDSKVMLKLSGEARLKGQLPPPVTMLYATGALSGEVTVTGGVDMSPDVVAQSAVAQLFATVEPTIRIEGAIGAGSRYVDIYAEIGVGGQLEGSMNLPLMDVYKDLSLTGSVDIFGEFKALIFGGRVSKKLVEVQLWPVEDKAATALVTAEDMEILPRTYAASVLAGENAALSAVGARAPQFASAPGDEENDYPYTDVQLWALSGDRYLLVYTDDDLTRESADRSTLRAAIGTLTDGTLVWGESVTLDPDGTADLVFDVCVSNGHAAVVWQDLNTTFGDGADADFETVASAVELNTMLLDCTGDIPEVGEITELSTGTDVYESIPRIWYDGYYQKKRLSWVTSTVNDPLYDGDETYTLWLSDGGDAIAVADTQSPIMAIGLAESELFWSEQAENGGSLWQMDSEGAITKLLESGVRNLQSRGNHSCYTYDGILYQRMDYDSNFRALAVDLDESNSVRLSGDGNIWVGAAGLDESVIYLLESEVLRPVFCHEGFLSGWDADGTCVTALMKTGFGEDDTARLVSSQRQTLEAVTLGEIECSDPMAAPGSTMRLRIPVRNDGTYSFNIDDVQVLAQDGTVLYSNPGWSSYDYPDAGETVEVDIQFTLPEDFVPQTLTVSINGLTKTIAVGGSNLAVEGEWDIYDADSVSIFLHNTGSVADTGKLTLWQDGKAIWTTEATVAAGEMAAFLVPLGKYYDAPAEMTVTLEESDAGLYTGDNEDVIYIRPNYARSLVVTVPTLTEGEQEAIGVRAWPDGSVMPSVTYASADPAIAVVSADGIITAVATGETEIIVTTDQGRSFTATLTVAATHVHSFTNYVSDNNATCTADGTRTAVCDSCQVTDTIPDVGSALGHSWDEGVVTVEPTATTEGEMTYTCMRCGETRTEVLEPQGSGGWAWIDINGEGYEFSLDSDGGTTAWQWRFSGDYDENSNEIQVRVAASLPEGFSYDLNTNTITLNNASLERLGLSAHWVDQSSGDEGWNLPSEDLTIELIGENTISCGWQSALSLSDGIHATITGEGSLMLRSENNLQTDENGNYVNYNTINMWFGAGLTIAGNATVTVEIAGEAMESCWDGDTYLGTRPAQPAAIEGGMGSLTLKDNASLTTIVPEGSRMNGPKLENEEQVFWDDWYPGGYRGIRSMYTITIEGGTLNTQEIDIPSNWDENGFVSAGAFTQSGGTVSITARGSYGETEKWVWDEQAQENISVGIVDHYHYNGLANYDGGHVEITGGELNIKCLQTAEEMASSAWADGIRVGGEGEVIVSGGTVNVEVNCGYAVTVNDLTVSSGTLNAISYDGSGMEVWNCHLNGGTVNAEGCNDLSARLYDLTIDGSTLNIRNEAGPGLYSNDIKATDGLLDVQCDDGGCIDVWNSFTVEGGTINLSGKYGDVLNLCDADAKISGGTVTITGEDCLLIGVGGFDPDDRESSADGSLEMTGGKLIANYTGNHGTAMETRPLGQTTITGDAQVELNGHLVTYGPLDIAQNASVCVTNGGFHVVSGGVMTLDGGELSVEDVWEYEYDNDYPTANNVERSAALIVNGGRLTLEHNNFRVGLNLDGNFTLNGGEVTVASTNAGDNLDDQVSYAIRSQGITTINDGVLNLTGTIGYNQFYDGSNTDTKLTVNGGTINVNVTFMGLCFFAPGEINDGSFNIELTGLYQPSTDYYNSMGLSVVNLHYEGVDPSLVINGGVFDVNALHPEDNYYSAGLLADGCHMTINGGTIHTRALYAMYGINDERCFVMADDLSIISLSTADRKDLLVRFDEGSYTDADGNVVDSAIWYASVEEDNVPGNSITGEGMDECTNLLITANTCGEATWDMADGELIISGQGGMEDYASGDETPWSILRDKITTVTVEAGVTSVGDYAFAGYSELTEISFEGDAPAIGGNAFRGVTATAYYHRECSGWNADVLHDYGGNITWVPCDPGHEKPVENPFTDVAPGSFFYEPVMWAIENGITNGTSATTFGPNDQCMRAHVVTFLWRAVGSPEPTRTDNPFVDVKPTDFYYKPVLWAVENGITSGMDATHFGPTAYCNRAQVVTFLYRTMGSPDVGAATNPFTDVAAGSFYEKPVLWAVENGVTAGLSATSFGPNSICNRAQIVTFLYRAFVD